MPRVAVEGVQLGYERRGAGPPLLLVQGMGANSGHWGEPLLAARARLRARRSSSATSR